MHNLLGTEVGSGAILSGPYRYTLWRTWAEGSRVAFIMLNPSTANALNDDPTVRRCIGFARRWGHGGLDVVNLFAVRATDPAEMMTRFADPVGPLNDEYITTIVAAAEVVVAAWGDVGRFRRRDERVLELIRHREIRCLGTTKLGNPVHPLRQPASAELRVWRRQA